MRGLLGWFLVAGGIVLMLVLGVDFLGLRSNVIPSSQKTVPPEIFPNNTNLTMPSETVDEIALQSLQKTHEQMLVALKEARVCFENAKEKAEAFVCSQKMRMITAEHSRAFSEVDDTPLHIDIDSFSWDKEQKQKILWEISNSLIQMRSEKTCVDALMSINEIGECFDLK